jgi:hypothetical protein
MAHMANNNLIEGYVVEIKAGIVVAADLKLLDAEGLEAANGFRRQETGDRCGDAVAQARPQRRRDRQVRGRPVPSGQTYFQASLRHLAISIR